ncbi:MAG: CDP-alcohol phosphatidyltransferase family protein [Gemmatimonadales bacterium]
MKLVTKSVERVFFRATDPLVGWLLARGVRPNAITTLGVLIVVASAVAYGAGWVRTGGALLLLSGGVDTLDGQVARRGGLVSKFGAFYDSTLDRVGDGATFIGIAVFFLTAPGIEYRLLAAVACMVAVLSSLLVSYARARAEGLGLDCKVGIVQRAERLIGIGVPSLFVGAGPNGVVLQVIVGLLAILSSITVVQRFVYVYRITDGA